MTDERLDPLADAVLDAWEAGAQVDYGTTKGDAKARRELEQLERSAALAAAAMAAAEGNSHPMPQAFAARMLALGQQIAATQPATGPRTDQPAAPLVGRPVTRGNPLAPFLLGAVLGLVGGLPLGARLFCTGSSGDVAQLRDQLVASAVVHKATFQPGQTTTFGSVQGDVVWSDEKQEGYLRLDGLQPLPNDHQYQLWIVDVNRVGAPVDGGVFDLAHEGPQVVAIDAKLRVAEAKAFVVTVERRGGVVVSDQKNVVAIASL